MNSQKLAATLFGLAIAGIFGSGIYYIIIPKYANTKVANLASGREYNLKLSAMLAGPPGPDGPPFTYKPNIHFPGMLSTNSLGMRSPELAAEKKLPRIMLLGDSFTFGYGLVEGEPFSDVLAERLKGVAEIANAAVSGFEIQDSTAQFLRFVDRVNPDCVVVTFVSNDLDDSRVYQSGASGGYVREPRVEELKDGIFASTTNLNRIAAMEGMQGETKDKFIIKFSKGSDYLPWGIGPFARKRWEHYKSEFAKIVNAAKARNARVIMYTFAPRQSPIVGKLYEVSQEFGVPLAVQDPSLDLNDPQYKLSWDPHPNAEANKIFADRLLRVLVGQNVVKAPGVEALAPVAPMPGEIEKWQYEGKAPARHTLKNSVVFMPREEQVNLHQAIGGFEDSLGLLGPRAIVLLHSERPVSKLRIRAVSEGGGESDDERTLEVRVTANEPPTIFKIGKEARDFEIALTDAMKEKVKLEKETTLVEVDLRDPLILTMALETRRSRLAIRIGRIEIY
ncbi:MAG: hypothetical protein HY286_10005 [Planctomycetes bacterium]|nr:hypothetical protein [Planctomycetota bacterium]